MWGKNHFGQLGIPKVEDQEGTLDQSSDILLKKNMDPNMYIGPVQAQVEMDILQVACGEEHSIILTKEGQVFSMGNNVNGQLGLNLKVKKEKAKSKGDPMPGDFHRCFSPEPVRFVNMESKVVKIACGEQHTLALTQRGQVYAWGQAKHGQLGIDFN